MTPRLAMPAATRPIWSAVATTSCWPKAEYAWVGLLELMALPVGNFETPARREVDRDDAG